MIGGLAQNVVSLCSAKDGETEEMRRLRIEIISDLLVSLLTLTYGTDSPDDVTSRGVRKVRNRRPRAIVRGETEGHCER